MVQQELIKLHYVIQKNGGNVDPGKRITNAHPVNFVTYPVSIIVESVKLETNVVMMMNVAAAKSATNGLVLSLLLVTVKNKIMMVMMIVRI